MQTNKITANIEIEIEDDRMYSDRAIYPIDDEYIKNHLQCRLRGSFFTTNELNVKTIIHNTKQSNPVPQDTINYYQACNAIRNEFYASIYHSVLKEFEDRVDLMESVRENDEQSREDLLSIVMYDEYVKRIHLTEEALDNWDWRPDCTNSELGEENEKS